MQSIPTTFNSLHLHLGDLKGIVEEGGGEGKRDYEVGRSVAARHFSIQILERHCAQREEERTPDFNGIESQKGILGRTKSRKCTTLLSNGVHNRFKFYPSFLAQAGGSLSSASSPEDDALTSPSISSASTSSSSAVALVSTEDILEEEDVEDILLESNSILHEHDGEEEEDEEEGAEYVEEELSSLSLPTDPIFGELLYSRDNGTDEGWVTIQC